jgi:hypothetical protein
MNIGFFGDSYASLEIDMHEKLGKLDIYLGNITWPFRLCNALAYTPVTSGLGGSDQFYAINTWQNTIKNTQVDYAIFTFTWSHRLYVEGTNHLLYPDDVYSVVRDHIEHRKKSNLSDIESDIIKAIDGYYTYLHSKTKDKFLHELMLKWILDLPEQYPDTRFIFLPNTEMSREIALRYFKKGILLDFAFEKISLLEGEHVGVDPYFDNKFGHLSDINHERFKDLLKNIILSYNTHEDKVYPVNYEQFRLD